MRRHGQETGRDVDHLNGVQDWAAAVRGGPELNLARRADGRAAGRLDLIAGPRNR